MNTIPLLLASGLLLFFNLEARAQGSLTPPPGPPAPTMKRLDQVEARTIVNADNTPGDANNTFIISSPGSYYLVGNITGEPDKHGISIQADDVALDMNGFMLANGGGATRGIDVPAEQNNFTIHNGTVRGWAGGGVRADTVRAVRAEKLTLVGNTGGVGIAVGLGSLIKDCVANRNGVGFMTPDRCQISNCIATEHTGSGFQAGNYVSLIDCTSSRNDGTGFAVGGHVSILRCSATRNVFNGIIAGSDCTISDCTVGFNPGVGIFAFTSSVKGCTVNSNGYWGIYSPGGTVSDCTASGNADDGITAVSVTGCVANSNAGRGIYADTVAGCNANGNGKHGIEVVLGNVTNSKATSNEQKGIYAGLSSVTNCAAFANKGDGIDASSGGVVAFCVARSNNVANNFSVDIRAANSHRMLNEPQP